MNVQLNYYNPENKTVVTDDGFRYLSTKSVITRQKEISAETDIEIFETFYALNNSLRYCNGSHYEFNDTEWKDKYKNWLKSDDYKAKSFNLYYGNGVVD